MRVLVCGGRKFSGRLLIRNTLAHLAVRPVVIIHGAAPGADTLAAKWAEEHGVEVLPYPAAWDDLSHPDAVIRTRRDGTKYDAKAGHRRNKRMLDEGKPDLVVAFPGGTGTADMVAQAHAAHVKVLEVA